MPDPKSNIPSNLPVAQDPDLAKPSLPAPLKLQPPRTVIPLPAPKPPVVSLSKPLVLPSPSLPKPPSAALPSAVSPLPPPGMKSSIRTMESDIQSARAGQAPKGVETKIPSGLAPVPPPVKPVSPQFLPPKSIQPIVKIGEAEKRGALPTMPTPKPSLPAPPKAAQAGIAVPSQARGLSALLNRRNLMILLLIVLVGGGSYWFFVLRQVPEETGLVSPTPSPTGEVTLTPTPGAVRLAAFFPSFYSVSLSATETSVSFLRSEIARISSDDSSKNLLINPYDSDGTSLGFSLFLDKFLISYPINLSDNLEQQDFGLLITKQSEFFDPLSGEIIANPSADLTSRRPTSLIVRATDAQAVKDNLDTWEETLHQDLQELFLLPDPDSERPVQFLDNIYRDIAIRYANFPYPDFSIDYAVVTATDNNDYLILANSREQMYEIIDVLLGF